MRSHRTSAEVPVRIDTYYSKSLKLVQPYSFILPEAAADSSRTFPLIMLLHGRDSHHDEPGKYTRLARYAAAVEAIIVCPEGDNGWYTNSADGLQLYEDDIILDLIPHVQSALPIADPGRQWAIGGFSMGGYGAIKLALKHHQLFLTAFSSSGAVEKPMQPKISPIFGDPEKDLGFRRAESLATLCEHALSRYPVERPFLFLDCGLKDPLLEANQNYANHLRFIGYPYEYTEMVGWHTWPYFDRALKNVLPKILHRIVS